MLLYVGARTLFRSAHPSIDMTTTSSRRRRLWVTRLAVVTLFLSGIAGAQDDAAPANSPSLAAAPTTARVFTITDFARFAPRNALEMLESRDLSVQPIFTLTMKGSF